MRGWEISLRGPHWFCGFCGTTEQLAEKVDGENRNCRTIPRRL